MKRYFYKYVNGLTPKITPSLPRQGTMGHEGLRAEWAGEDWEKAIDECWKENIKSMPKNLISDEEKAEKDLIKKIVERYFEHHEYFRRPNEKDLIEPETRFSVPIPNTEWNLMGYMDKVIEVPGEGVWLVEHKFTSTSLDRYFDNLEMKEQIDYYTWALTKMFPEKTIMGCIYNGILLDTPTVPKPIKSGKRLSKRKMKTDYETYYNAIIDNDFDPADYEKQLLKLKNQDNPFFQTEWCDRDKIELEKIERELMWLAFEIEKTTFPIRTRAMDRCSWDCDYKQLCLVEKKGGDVESVIDEDFEYYEDRKKKENQEDDENTEEKPF